MRVPIVFHPEYDIKLSGLEKLHRFDTCKYGKVYQSLLDAGCFQPGDTWEPMEAMPDLMVRVHTHDYIYSLRNPAAIAKIAEITLLSSMPSYLLGWHTLRPMRLACGGTVMAAELALQHGWAINLSGGYHHAKTEEGSGFCFFADLNMAAEQIWKSQPNLKILVVDLDAHQGNGLESIFGDDPRVAVLDLYNGDIYPYDMDARQYIRYNYPLKPGTEDLEYFEVLMPALKAAIEAEKPGLILYNAGTDIYEKDPLGGLRITAEGVCFRDKYVFETARGYGIPVAMALSGGYTQQSAALISRSIQEMGKAFGWFDSTVSGSGPAQP